MRSRSKWQGWTGRGQIERMRDSDPLLAYLSNARGVLEHGVAEVARELPGGIAINPASGNALTIERMTVAGRGISIKSPDAIKVTITPATIALADVTNRGRTYPVPKFHDGKELQSSDPVTLAELAVSFYDGALQTVERAFS